MKLSIIILNYNSLNLTKKCLTSLEKHAPTCSYEVIVIDNASSENGFEELKKDYPRHTFLCAPKNLGYGQGNHLGVERSSGEFLAFLNPDIELREGTLDKLISFLEKTPDAGIAGPALFYPNGKMQDSFRRFPSISDLIIKRIPLLNKFFEARLRRFLLWDINLNIPSPVDWVVGALLIIRKETYETINGFDKRYFLFFEDTDLCRSALEKGYKTYFVPTASAIHNHERLSETKNPLDFFRKKTFRIHLASAFKYFYKWKGKKTFSNA